MKIITFTNLFPSAVQPRHGIFVEERLQQLLRTGQVEARVIAPVPWFPFASHRFGRYAELARVPRHEERGNVSVTYPRYPVIPKVGMTVAPALMAAALLGAVRRTRDELGDGVVLDAHFLYPDGVAAAWIARRLDLPLILTARGNDVTLYPRYRAPRAMILRAVRQAARVITVSEALRTQLIALGADAGSIVTLRNGVDLDRFRPADRATARANLGFTRPTLLSVGHLIERKGHEIVIEALASLPDIRYCIVGEGPLGEKLRHTARALGVADRVTFVGNIPQAELIDYYNAADALALPSSREGMPNVVLESLACGTPVIAARCEGTPELITVPAAGILMAQRDAASFVDACTQLLNNLPSSAATRAHAETLGWTPTIAGLLDVIRKAGNAH